MVGFFKVSSARDSLNESPHHEKIGVNGCRNRDIRERLASSPVLRSCGWCVGKQLTKIFRLLKRFHIYGLVAKIPRSRRWCLTKKGWALLSAAVALKKQVFPISYEQASA